MSAKPTSRVISRILAFAVTGLFLLGLVFPPVGAWTGRVLGQWFAGTQKPWRGVAWMVAVGLAISLIGAALQAPPDSLAAALTLLGWTLAVVALGVAPYGVHRLIGPHLPGLAAILPLPLAAVAIHDLAMSQLPRTIFDSAGFAANLRAATPLAWLGTDLGVGASLLLVNGFAALVVWMWRRELRASRMALGIGLFALAAAALAGFGQALPSGASPASALVSEGNLDLACLGGLLLLGAWASARTTAERRPWAGRLATIARLRSPVTGEALRVVAKGGREALVSASGERFPVRDGIVVFLPAARLQGSNRKYNQLYQTIGGFYDDTQRVESAFTGRDRDAYVMSYLRHLEIKPGDHVLETSVGTGLNFKYLPRDIARSGLDISAEMLANCGANLRRWRMDADLYQGEAEHLPFADASFDVVFHVGAINFFSDREGAIREMIRVAKPGSRLLIADETEEHVKAAYENIPITSGYFKNRGEAVAAPIHLVPPEMLEVAFELLENGRFYALTFRKPG